VHIISRAVYRSNDEGYLDPKRHEHIWVLEPPTASDELPKPVQLTSGDFDEASARLEPRQFAHVLPYRRVDEPYYEPRPRIFTPFSLREEIPKSLPPFPWESAISSSARTAASLPFMAQSSSRFAPIRSPISGSWRCSRDAQPKNLTVDYDFDMGSSVFGDNAAPRGGHGRTLYWSPDGRWLFDSVAKRGRTLLVRVDAQSGAVTEITLGDQAVLDFSTAPDTQTIVALVSTPVDAWRSLHARPRRHQTRITDFNRKLWSQLNLTAPEEIDYTSFDGKRIQGWIQKPPDFDPQKKYPLILNIHGGPHAAYGWVFEHEFQWMAAKGYVVLYVNPRGSTSYGQDFGNIIQYHYPGDDYRDLMIGVDELLKRGYVDPKKLGVTGGSGGGVLTDWTITHTDRFAAAVSQRDISNWASWWYTADFTLFQPNWFKAPPFEDPQDYATARPLPL
jgi:dipeptidyl aminopeptidase/acylaminoacyl peptidase